MIEVDSIRGGDFWRWKMKKGLEVKILGRRDKNENGCPFLCDHP